MYSATPAPVERVDVLVLATHAPELVGFRQHLGEKLDGQVRGMRVLAKTVGVGLPVAGGSTAGRFTMFRPRIAILVGTCGVYPNLPHFRPHDLVIANRVSLMDHAVIAGRAQFPDPMQTTIETHPVLASGLLAAVPRARLTSVASPLVQTTDDSLASTVHPATGCEAEHLEAFSVGLGAVLAHVPFAAVLGVSNIVGSRGKEDWLQFHRQSSIASAEAVLAWIHGGAVGMPHS